MRITTGAITTKQDLHRHILSGHLDGAGVCAGYLSAEATKAKLRAWHQRLHADLTSAHEHDPKNGAAIPLGNVLPFERKLGRKRRAPSGLRAALGLDGGRPEAQITQVLA